ncbi:antibiotic biosynthesis monooxygenase [Gemmata sp. JC673]|uniref:Antibiotic biosynthesis monooxygenase n=1 Tax=Gemmata algarum TaxID=2975278 RepID=A0ABU5F8E9_9BACT|nr:antibiotic biosynthesis monooxygenase [Gemmata algarum]MDY3563540.1 antibiotic biosynthesis monooxygenase [Gemmata algarum]
MPADPVTVVVTRVVRPGHEEAFERALREWVPRSVTHPGHLGVLILRPPAGGREYGAVLRFESWGAWENLRDSDDYRAFLEAIRDHLEHDPRVHTASGLEAWVAPAGAAFVPVPPRWKLALLTWAGVNLTALALTFILAPFTARLPWFVGFLIFNAAVVAGLTWVVMPVLSRAARRWLQGPPAGPGHAQRRMPI